MEAVEINKQSSLRKDTVSQVIEPKVSLSSDEASSKSSVTRVSDALPREIDFKLVLGKSSKWKTKDSWMRHGTPRLDAKVKISSSSMPISRRTEKDQQVSPSGDSHFSDEPSSEKIVEVCQATEPRESVSPDEVRANSSATGASGLEKVINFFLLLVMIVVMTLHHGEILRNKLPKKDWNLDGKEIFSLLTTLEDKKWAHHAMAHLWAKEYGIEEAQKKSSEFLQSELTLANVWVAVVLADFTDDKGLQDAIALFISQNEDKTKLDRVWVKQVASGISQAIRNPEPRPN